MEETLQIIASTNCDAEDGVAAVNTGELFEQWSDGVSECRTWDMRTVITKLGITWEEEEEDPEDQFQFPWFSERHDPETRYDPWSAEGQALLETESTERLQLMWHQAVGVYRILSNLFEHKQMLVMDEVGVGKTIQAIGSIAMYRSLQLLFEGNKTYPESFGKWLCTDFCGLADFGTAKLEYGSHVLPVRPHLVVVPPGLVSQWTQECHRYLKKGSFDILPYTGTCTEANRVSFWELYKRRTENTAACSNVIIIASSTVRLNTVLRPR